MPPHTPKLGEVPQDAAAAAPADDASAVVGGMQNRLKKYLDDVRNPDSAYNRAFQAIRFDESELENEEFDKNPQLFAETIFGKNKDLQEYLNSFPEEDRADIKEKIIDRLKKETYPKWEEGHKVYCPKTAQLMIENGKEVVDELKFSEEELENEELDKDDEKLMEFILKKSPELADYRSKLGGKALKRFDEEVMGKAKLKWKEEHKVYCPETAKLTIKEGTEIVDELKFTEEELEDEELDKDEKKLVEFLLKKSPDLADYRSKLGGKALKRFDEEVMGKAKLKWKEGHKVYCPETAKLTINEGAEIASDMKFSDGELAKDELHDNPDELKKFLLKKDGLGELRDGLRGKALKKFDEEVTEPLMKRWREEHEAFEFREHQQKILARAQKGEIPPEVNDPSLDEASFTSKYFDLLADQEDELKQSKHADLRKKLSEDQHIADAIKSRYAELRQGAKLEEVKGEIDQALKGIRFTPEEVGDDRYHDDPDAFVEAFKDRIGDELLAKMETVGGANKEASRAYLLQQLRGVLYPQWKAQHEAHELLEKEETLLEKLQGEIPLEITAENLKEPDFFKKLFDHHANEDEELNDQKHADLRQKLFERPAVKAALKGKQQEYQEAAAARLAKDLERTVEALTFSEGEYKEEKYHTDLKAFGEYVVNQKLDPELLKQLDFLDADKRKTVLKNLAKHAQDKLHPEWKKNHEALEEEDITAKIVGNIKQGKISADLKTNPLSAESFGERYLVDTLEGSEIAFDEPHHQAMRDRILRSPQIRSALAEKYHAYREELKADTRAEIDRELRNMAFTEQERDNDDFHEDPKAFALAMQEKFGEKLKARIQAIDGDSSELNDHARGQLETVVYQRWLREHESAEERKFIDELSNKILEEPITADFAREHYEEDEFRQAWYQRIADKLSPDLREEHKEVIEGLLQKSRVQEAFQKKFQEYEPMHEKVLEEQFTGELAELMRSVSIPEEMLQQDLSQAEFNAKYFAILLSHASPKMREELEEHPQLEQALLDKREVQAGLQQRYEEFQKLREKKHLAEATKESITLLQQHQIPAAILAKGIDSAELQQHLFELLQSRLSPELRKVFSENKDFREFLMKQQELQQVLQQKHQKNPDQALKANTTKGIEVIQRESKVSGIEGKALESEKESAEADDSDAVPNKKEAEGISDQEIEVLTSSPLGQQRLDSLRQSFGLRTLLRRREQFFTVFLQKWLSTISDYEFRNFSRLVRKKGTTPQQIIAAMTTNSHRKIRLQKLKFLNQSDWRRFAQGLQYIKVKPEDLVAGRLSVEPLVKKNDEASQAAPLRNEELRSRIDELFEQQQPSEESVSVEQPESEEPKTVIMDEQVAIPEATDELQIEPMKEIEEQLQAKVETPLQIDENLSGPKEPEMTVPTEEVSTPEAAPIEELHQLPDEEPAMETMPEAGLFQEQSMETFEEPTPTIEEIDAIAEPEPIENQEPAQAEISSEVPQDEIVESLQSNLHAEPVSQESMDELLPEQHPEEDMLAQGKEQEVQEPEMMEASTAPEEAAEGAGDLEVQMQRAAIGLDEMHRSLRLLRRHAEDLVKLLVRIESAEPHQKSETITWVAERLRHRILVELMQQMGKKQAAYEQLSELLYRYQFLMLRLGDEERKGSIEEDQGGSLHQRIMLGTLLNRFLFAIRLQSLETFETAISIDSTCLGASVLNADEVYADLWQHYGQVLKEQTLIARIAIFHGKEVGYGETRSIMLKIQYTTRTEGLIAEKSIPCQLEDDLPQSIMLREIPQAA